MKFSAVPSSARSISSMERGEARSASSSPQAADRAEVGRPETMYAAYVAFRDRERLGAFTATHDASLPTCDDPLSRFLRGDTDDAGCGLGHAVRVGSTTHLAADLSEVLHQAVLKIGEDPIRAGVVDRGQRFGHIDENVAEEVARNAGRDSVVVHAGFAHTAKPLVAEIGQINTLDRRAQRRASHLASFVRTPADEEFEPEPCRPRNDELEPLGLAVAFMASSLLLVIIGIVIGVNL